MRILRSLAALALAVTPVLAQEDIGFKPVPSRDITISAVSDADLQELISTLDSLLAREKDPAKWLQSGRIHLWRFSNRLDQGRISATQEARLIEYFDALSRAHPAYAGDLRSFRDGVTARRIGKIAPEIAGRDLDGVAFKLSDYRGQVVGLYFSGDWCGPCRGRQKHSKLELARPFSV